ncbi:NUCLEAR PORE COMPLEX PROTEIN NUP50 [Salix koriyanagi]|uniref:NUCLEAR PORE COMPLEX PROTEIN NUP50 n=1 Tax=Salix koriyanagi TaxID=2511006 RepID=A0A9Q0PW78_9ROSI|nr:NUCLEAR PORE COMPLEX PROTEIN NUP50 [Salix koriyanagi]
MKGAKRFAVSDSVPDSNDTALRNKRITAGFLFDVHRPEPSQQQLTPLPPLDVKRAESSQLHVRALNNQFASWVQTQLKNHPDELWEDGIRDYLAHASNIMEKFSDVVNWLKANAAKGVSVADSLTTEKKSVPEIKNNERKLLEEKTVFALPSTSARFASSWSSSVVSGNESSGGVSSSSQSSSLFSNGESSGPFSTNLSSGLFSNNQSSGFFSNSQSFGLSSNNQSSGSLSSSQSTGALSNSQTPFSINQSTGAFSNSHSLGALSNSQSPFSFNQSSAAFSERQSLGALSNSQSPFSFNQSSAAFSERQSLGVLSNRQTPFSFGGQSSIPTTHNTADDADDENELQQPGSPSVKKSEEKGIVTVHEVKCKLYVKSSDPAVKDTWKDKGTGQLSIKCKEGISKGTKESKPTIVIRNDVGKVLLNALLYPGIKTNPQKNSLVAIFHTAGDDSGNNDCVVARTFLFRMKTEEDRNKLATAIQEYAPST